MWVASWYSFAEITELAIAQTQRRNGVLSLLLAAPAGAPLLSAVDGPVSVEIMALARQFLRTHRWADLVASYNPRCLVVLAVDSDAASAKLFAERLQQALEGDEPVKVGVATLPEDGVTLPELMAAAEASLAQVAPG